MVESIKELREICQKSEKKAMPTRFDEFVWNNLDRGMSIYFTKLFLIMGISANRVTFISFLFGVSAGILFIFGDAFYWILGTFCYWLCGVFDLADGEVARYNKAASKQGAYLDGLSGSFISAYLFLCMSVGIYHSLQNTTVFLVGLIILASLFLQQHLVVLGYRLFPETKEAYSMPFILGKAGMSTSILSRIMRYGTSVYYNCTSWYTLLVIVLIDCFIPPFLIGSITLNVRYLYLILFVLIMCVGTILLAISGSRLASVKSTKSQK